MFPAVEVMLFLSCLVLLPSSVVFCCLVLVPWVGLGSVVVVGMGYLALSVCLCVLFSIGCGCPVLSSPTSLLISSVVFCGFTRGPLSLRLRGCCRAFCC